MAHLRFFPDPPSDEETVNLLENKGQGSDNRPASQTEKLDEFLELSRLIFEIHKKCSAINFTGNEEDVVRYCTPYYQDKLKARFQADDTTPFTDSEMNEIIEQGMRDYNDFVRIHNIAVQEEQRIQAEEKKTNAGPRPGSSWGCCTIL